ncbi:MAG: glycogen/starch synthase [Patescibacteria group bacterium]
MKVLFAVWELDPFIKVGGLGEIAASLPRALSNLGIDIRIVIPFYRAVRLRRSRKKFIKQFTLKYADKLEKVELFQVTHPVSKLPVYLLKNSHYMDTPIFPDTFAFFDKVIVDLVAENHLSFIPEIIHCNDVHTGLIPLLLKENKISIKTMLTIHNLAHQGRTSLDILAKIGLEKNKCNVTQWEIESKKVNFLLEGITHADIITTVSPTYAKEIMTEEYGAGLEEVLRGKEGRIFGVLNGIDDQRTRSVHLMKVKHPYLLSSTFSKPQSLLGGLNPQQKKVLDLSQKNSWEEGKKLNKLYLQKKLGLRIDESIPLLAFIGRFAPKQKGIDILHKMLRTIDLRGYEFIILGKGDLEWEERFLWLDTFYPKNVACTFEFNDLLAHQIYAASDFILMPSKFEPCGLVQMIAMCYGTLPIAHRTGGLIDSIKNGHNGFLFDNYSSEALRETVEKAVSIWRHKKKQYQEMVENALSTDFSWDKSAKEYLRLYEKLISGS